MAELLRGTLGAVQAASLLQLIELDRLTGQLTLGSGSVAARQGQLVAARAGALEGVDALMALLEQREGPFVFVEEAVEQQAPLCSLVELSHGWSQLSDEWTRAAPTVLRRSEQPWESDPLSMAVAERLDGERTLAEAVLGVAHPYQVLDSLLAAQEAGALVVAGPPDPERAAAALEPPSPEDFYPLLDEARERRKAGDLAGAERLLRRALLLRPGDRTLQQNIRRLQALQGADATHNTRGAR